MPKSIKLNKKNRVNKTKRQRETNKLSRNRKSLRHRGKNILSRNHKSLRHRGKNRLSRNHKSLKQRVTNNSNKRNRKLTKNVGGSGWGSWGRAPVPPPGGSGISGIDNFKLLEMEAERKRQMAANAQPQKTWKEWASDCVGEACSRFTNYMQPKEIREPSVNEKAAAQVALENQIQTVNRNRERQNQNVKAFEAKRIHEANQEKKRADAAREDALDRAEEENARLTPDQQKTINKCKKKFGNTWGHYDHQNVSTREWLEYWNQECNK